MTRSVREAVRRYSSAAIILAICLITLLPIWLIFTLSVKTNSELMRGNVLGLPMEMMWSNYAQAWKAARFDRYLFNSIYVSALSVTGIVAFSTLGAYALSYFTFPLSGWIITLVVLGILVPTELTLIPAFLNMRTIGLSNTREAIILLHIAGNMPFGIFLLRGFMRSVSKSMIEAARIDGANEVSSLVRVVLPLVRPALMALIVFTFMWTWNNYFLSRVFLISDSVRTLPLGLDSFRNKYTRDNVMTAAGAVIVALPVLVVYLVFQQKMVQGMVIGALKE